MHLDLLKENMKDYAKDIKLNLQTVLTPEGAPGLSEKQIWSVALACAYATREKSLIDLIETDSAHFLDDAYLQATRSGATIMAMNNIYYRFLHLAEEAEFSQMSAKLRMNVIGKPGIEKFDFELLCLAVSAISGCGKCIKAHIHELRKANATSEAIQSAIRIASVINAVAQTIVIDTK